jgi:hypothetical protein
LFDQPRSKADVVVFAAKAGIPPGSIFAFFPPKEAKSKMGSGFRRNDGRDDVAQVDCRMVVACDFVRGLR